MKFIRYGIYQYRVFPTDINLYYHITVFSQTKSLMASDFYM